MEELPNKVYGVVAPLQYKDFRSVTSEVFIIRYLRFAVFPFFTATLATAFFFGPATFLTPFFGAYFNATCAAARRAIGTRKGEHET